MAGVTIEDCLHAVSNRHYLVPLAVIWARELNGGAESSVESDCDKSTVGGLNPIPTAVAEASG